MSARDVIRGRLPGHDGEMHYIFSSFHGSPLDKLTIVGAKEYTGPESICTSTLVLQDVFHLRRPWVERVRESDGETIRTEK
jgi:hypothetical protein